MVAKGCHSSVLSVWYRNPFTAHCHRVSQLCVRDAWSHTASVHLQHLAGYLSNFRPSPHFPVFKAEEPYHQPACVFPYPPASSHWAALSTFCRPVSQIHYGKRFIAESFPFGVHRTIHKSGKINLRNPSHPETACPSAWSKSSPPIPILKGHRTFPDFQDSSSFCDFMFKSRSSKYLGWLAFYLHQIPSLRKIVILLVTMPGEVCHPFFITGSLQNSHIAVSQRYPIISSLLQEQW